MNLFDLFVKISADTKGAEDGMDSIGSRMQELTSRAGTMVSAVGSAASQIADAFSAVDSVVSGVGERVTKAFGGIAAAVGGAAAGLAKVGVEYNAQMETYQMAFTTLLGSAEEARGHPPHGGCGLKLPALSQMVATASCHPPHGGCGLK